jgi:hypothetical protein
MANPNQVANKGKGKFDWNWHIKLPKWKIKLLIEPKRMRSKRSIICLQIKLYKWQIQIKLPTKAKVHSS